MACYLKLHMRNEPNPIRVFDHVDIALPKNDISLAVSRNITNAFLAINGGHKGKIQPTNCSISIVSSRQDLNVEQFEAAAKAIQEGMAVAQNRCQGHINLDVFVSTQDQGLASSPTRPADFYDVLMGSMATAFISHFRKA